MYQKGKDKGFLGAHRWELIDWWTFCSKKTSKNAHHEIARVWRHFLASQQVKSDQKKCKKTHFKQKSLVNPLELILHLLSLNLEKRRRESGKLFDVEKGHFPIPPPFKDNWQRHGGDSSKGIREWILSQCFIEQLYLQTFPFDTFQKWWKGPDQPSPHFESWYVTNSKTSHDLRGGLGTQSPT